MSVNIKQNDQLTKVAGYYKATPLVNTATIYSEDERCIGLWTDGKPLYQRTYRGSWSITPNSAWIATGIDISDVDYIVDGWCGASTFRNNFSILKSEGSLYVTSIYSASGGSLSVSQITIQYTKTADSPIDDVVIGKPTMYIASSDCYSTEEKEIGCWTDGKPLYQKTKVVPINLTNTTYEEALTSFASDIEVLVKLEGTFYSNGSVMSIPRIFLGSTATQNYGYSLNISNANIVLAVGSDTTLNGIFAYTCQYTKTTDTPGSGKFTPASGKAIHYSADEQVIGTWVDGKPLYRKVLPEVSIPSANTEVEYTHNLGVKYYVNMSGWCKVNGNAHTTPFPFEQIRWSGWCTITNSSPNSLTFASTWGNNTVCCYIEYTKASDYSS